ncbi:hypothetical protein [Azospirillum tabaci]|uniref:hypothetical protein n=1 Tax=Azospirillum tabaci TaxID=2752310 RepID=UPI0016614A10|nr:hypothetical protein [Azospirillum tabaci]
MLMTEEQARTKWCPKARASDQAEPPLSINRVRTNKPDGDCLCIASDCMAWRWAGEKTAYQRLVGRNDPTPEPPWAPTGRVSTAGREVWEMDAGSRQGFCGAFGKPEAA